MKKNKDKPKLRYFKIQELMFGCPVHVFIGDHDEYVESAVQRFGGLPEDFASEPQFHAHFRGLEKHNPYQGLLILWFAGFAKKTRDVGTLAHEVTHLVDNIMEGIGAPPGYVSTELRAYMTGFYVNQFLINFVEGSTKPKRKRRMKKTTVQTPGVIQGVAQ